MTLLTRMRTMQRRTFFFAIAALAVASCNKKDSGGAAPAVSASASASTSASAMPSADPDDVKPVYPLDVPEDPLARRLCDALRNTKEKQRASCCKRKFEPVPILTSECTRMLSGALAAKAVTIDVADVGKCEAALEKTYVGCDWVGPNPPSPPAECQGIVHGMLTAKTRCRSSLECKDTLHCRGVGPTDPGRCAEPGGDDSPCIGSVDPLAVYLSQTELEREHPECAGFCDLHRCKTRGVANTKCKSTMQCADGLVCTNEICVAGSPGKLGEPCKGFACEKGLLCLGGKCSTRKPAGEPCEIELDCIGGCVRKPAQNNGVCGIRCDVQ